MGNEIYQGKLLTQFVSEDTADNVGRYPWTTISATQQTSTHKNLFQQSPRRAQYESTSIPTVFKLVRPQQLNVQGLMITFMGSWQMEE